MQNNKFKLKKVLKNGRITKRKLKRSSKYGVGINKGVIEEFGFLTTKSGREAAELILVDEKSGRRSKFFNVIDSARGENLMDNLLDILGLEEAYPEDLEGSLVGFETQMQDGFLNIKSFFSVDEDEEEEYKENGCDDDLYLEDDIEEEYEDDFEEE